MGRDGRGLRRLDRLVPPRHARDELHVVGIPKHLMCMCSPHAPHSQRIVPLRQCVHKRRPAKRFGAYTVGLAAVGAVLLNSVPLKYLKVPLLHDIPFEFPNAGFVVQQPQCSGGGGDISWPRTTP